MEPEAQEPQHISELLEDSVSAPHDYERAKQVKRADLTSEVDGLVDEIEDIQEHMSATGDSNLPTALDSATQVATDAQADKRKLDEQNNG